MSIEENKAIARRFSAQDALAPRDARGVPLVETRPSTSGSCVLAATILGSSMAFIDGTVVNVALPVLQTALKATVGDVQWVVEAYALFLAALILVGGSLGVPSGEDASLLQVLDCSRLPRSYAVLHRMSPCSSLHEQFKA